MMALNILLVEDETNLGATLRDYLQSKGYRVKWADSLKMAQNALEEFNPHIIILDLGLPDGNGLELIPSLEQAHIDYSLIILSALNDPEVRVSGLEAGALEYITKPFHLKELTIHIERIRKKLEASGTKVHGNLKIWFERFEVQDGSGDIIPLAQKEQAILKLLYDKKFQAVTRDEILETIWGADAYPSTRTVDNYIVKLRKWCETGHGIEIKSIRGIGYKLSAH